MKLLIATLCLAVASGAALAQAESASTSAPGVTRDIVTAEQKQEIRKLVAAGGTRKEAREKVLSEEQRAKLAKTSKSESGSRKKGETAMGQLDLTEAQKAKMSKIRAEGGSRKDLRGVLTKDQAAKYDELRSARKGSKDKNDKKNKEAKRDKKDKADSE